MSLASVSSAPGALTLDAQGDPYASRAWGLTVLCSEGEVRVRLLVKTEAEAPPRFAQAMGLAIAGVGLICLAAGATTAGLVVTALARAAAYGEWRKEPLGKVPAIKHKGKVVTEVAAICCYLADAFPEANLAPPVNDRADYYRWIFFTSGPIEAAFSNKAAGWEPTPEKQRMFGYRFIGGSPERLADHLRSEIKRWADVVAKNKIKAEVIPIDTRERGVTLLKEGGADAFASDRFLLFNLLKTAESPREIIPPTRSMNSSGTGPAQDNSE